MKNAKGGLKGNHERAKKRTVAGAVQRTTPLRSRFPPALPFQRRVLVCGAAQPSRTCHRQAHAVVPKLLILTNYMSYFTFPLSRTSSHAVSLNAFHNTSCMKQVDIVIPAYTPACSITSCKFVSFSSSSFGA